jgi:hypothetical protein
MYLVGEGVGRSYRLEECTGTLLLPEELLGFNASGVLPLTVALSA